MAAITILRPPRSGRHAKGRWRGAVRSTGAAALLLAAALFVIYQDRLLGAPLRGTSSSGTPSLYQSVPLPRLKRPLPDAARGDGASPRDRQWSFITSKMCPNFAPNPNVWSALFELGRRELGFPDDRIETRPMDLMAQESFFKFNYGGLGYSYGEDRYAIYLRIFKAGNDAIRANLQDALGKDDDGDASGHLKDFKTIWASYSPNDGMGRIDPKKVCVVTAVRDPISHFLSAYNEVEYREAERRRTGKRAELDQNWDDHPPPFLSYGNGTVARFEQFVKDLIGGPRTSGLFGSYKTYGVQQITHAFSMTGVLWGLKRLRDCKGAENAPNLTAYLPSLANLDTGFPELLHDACPGLPPFGAFEKNVVHESQSDAYGFYSAAKRGWGDQGKVARALCAIHTLDYVCFDSVPIPDLCQEVYAQNRFRHTLMRAMGTGEKQFSPCSKGNFP